MSVDSFNHTISFWLTALNHYTFAQLLLKPSPTSWSLGQLYMHLIENTDWFFDQCKTCMSCNDNHDKKASTAGKKMLLNNEFPDIQMEGPPDNDFTPQPKSKKAIYNDLIRQKDEVATLARLIRTASFKGKTQHPGLQYFNASEWFQFAEMHLRHHLRQKKRIDEFLKSQGEIS
jgi:hypothetical protein